MPTAIAPLSSEAILAELGYTPADDEMVVHVSGNETIAGVKTFSTPIADGSIASSATWNAKQNALGYTAENQANKATDFNTVNNTLYPTVAAVKTYADALVVGLLDDRGNYDASGNVFPSSGGSGTAGAILKGDLWVISVAGTLGGTPVAVGDQIRALVDSPGQTAGNWAVSEANIGYVAENQANKATGFGTLNNTLYPTTQAVANYAQPLDAELTAIAGLTSAADRLPYFDGSGSAALAVFTVFGRSLVDDADAAAGRTTLGFPSLTGNNGKYLTTDGSSMSWATVSAGPTINASDGVLPYRSNSTTFTDSPLSVASSAVVMTRNNIGATSSDGFTLTNTQAATVGAQQWSPRLHFHGSGWKTNATAAAQDVDWIVELVPVQGAAAPTVNLVFSAGINGGAYSALFSLLSGSGPSAAHTGSASERFGSGASATGQNGSAWGNGASANAAHATALGTNASANLQGATIIGVGATANSSGLECVSVGQASGSNATGTVTLGKSAVGLVNYAICIGHSASITSGGVNSIVMGQGATTSNPNTFVAGSTFGAITNVYFGKGETHATPTAYTINGTGGSGTNIAGANVALAGGQGTGSGAGGSVKLRVAPAGTSGTGLNALADSLVIDSTHLATFTGFVVDAGIKRVSSQFDKTSDTTLANITGLSVTVTAGRSYTFRAVLFTTSNSSGGVKVAIGGTATATAIIYEARTIDAGVITQSRTTTLGNAVGAITAVTAAQIIIEGTITVNAGGTLTVQFAQNASNGTASSVLVGSSFTVRDCP